MSELPDGWVSASISMLIDLNPKNDIADDALAGFMPMSFLGKDFLDIPDFEPRQWGEIKKSYTHFADGDVLLAKITPCFENGKAGIPSGLPNGVGAGSSEYFVCRTRPKVILPKYLLAYFKTPDFLLLGESQMTGSVGHKRVPKNYLLDTQIPLAPLNEQKRIADKLDRLLAKVDACRERCDRIPLILKRFRQSVLAAATSGELTEDWRVEYTAQMKVKSVAKTVLNSTQSSTSYEKVCLRDLVQEPLRNGKSVRDGDGTLVLRLSCLKHGRVDWTEVKHGDWGDIDVNRFLVKEGDFLVARGNGSRDLVGRGSLVVEKPPVVAFPDTMIRVRPDKSSILPRYLQIIWDGNEVRAQIELTARTTAGIWKVAQGDLENLLLPVPKIHEQQEIVRRVEKLFAFADRLESRYQTARAKCDRLTPALLEKAFQGELVPQDPNDEPASVLLERIKSLRSHAEANQTKPQRRKTAPSR